MIIMGVQIWAFKQAFESTQIVLMGISYGYFFQNRPRGLI